MVSFWQYLPIDHEISETKINLLKIHEYWRQIFRKLIFLFYNYLFSNSQKCVCVCWFERNQNVYAFRRSSKKWPHFLQNRLVAYAMHLIVRFLSSLQTKRMTVQLTVASQISELAHYDCFSYKIDGQSLFFPLGHNVWTSGVSQNFRCPKELSFTAFCTFRSKIIA